MTTSISRDMISMSKQNQKLKQLMNVLSFCYTFRATTQNCILTIIHDHKPYIWSVKCINKVTFLWENLCKAIPVIEWGSRWDEAFFSLSSLKHWHSHLSWRHIPSPHPHALHSALIPFKDCYLYPSRQASHSKTVGKPTRSAHNYSGPLLWLCYNFLERKSESNNGAFSFVS